MVGSGAVEVESLIVFGGRVAFVAGESILGVLVVVLMKNFVAGDFGDDAGGGDGKAAGIAFDEGTLALGPPRLGKGEGIGK